MIKPIVQAADRSLAVPARRARTKRPFKKYDVLRAMDAVRAGGLDVACVEISPDGTIRLATASATGFAPQASEFEKWQDRL